jgi:general secretion pathway protein L
MARILGLDLGSYRVKGVVLETTLRGFTISDTFSAPVPTDGDRMERLKAALPRLIESGPLAVDTVVVALPGVSLATHPITLPFSDPKKIEATLAGEVESQVPFDLSEAVYDYQPGPTDERGTSLLVGVVKREELAQTLELLKVAKLDPRIVTHPGLVYQALFQGVRAPTAPGDEALAIIDIGHERTSIAIGSPLHGVELARTFPGGGLALSKALAAEFKISLGEATEWKEQHGAGGTEVVGPDA